MSRACTEDVFLKDVAGHAMQVLRDDGIYRHIRFAAEKNSWNQWFEIVTWPGRLALTGDMGTFVFSRLEDMFQFFRVRPSDEKSKLQINLSYWAEKLLAVDRDHRNNSEKDFSEEKLRERLEDHIMEWIEDHIMEWIEDEQLTEDEQAELRSEIEEQVVRYAEDGEGEAHRALSEFSCKVGGHTFKFSDTWEWDLREYTFRFVWCCYAISWAIQQYDALKAGMKADHEVAASRSRLFGA